MCVIHGKCFLLYLYLYLSICNYVLMGKVFCSLKKNKEKQISYIWATDFSHKVIVFITQFFFFISLSDFSFSRKKIKQWNLPLNKLFLIKIKKKKKKKMKLLINWCIYISMEIGSNIKFSSREFFFFLIK